MSLQKNKQAIYNSVLKSYQLDAYVKSPNTNLEQRQLGEIFINIHEKFKDYEDEELCGGEQGFLHFFKNVKMILKTNKRFKVFNAIYDKFVVNDEKKIKFIKVPKTETLKKLQTIANPNPYKDDDPRHKEIKKLDDKIVNQFASEL